jgi:hypothetical protein
MKSSPHQPPVSRPVDSVVMKQSAEELGTEVLLPALNKSDNEPEELPGSSSSDLGRKYSVESKDSDADSAKSSLLDANDTIMRDFGKEEDEEEEEAEMVSDIISSNKAFTTGNEEAMSLARQQQQQQQQAHLIHASGVQQAKMDEGYVSAEKVHPADPISQSLALFETSITGLGPTDSSASKRSRESVGVAAVANQQLEQQLTAAAGLSAVKSPTAVATMAATLPPALQMQKETSDMMDIARHQEYTGSSQMGKKQQQPKAVEEELSQYFNQAVAAAASSASATAASGINSAASTVAPMAASWSEQLQQLQQQQLQQQLQLMDTRSWQASSFSGQIEPLKGKQQAMTAVTEHDAEKKAAESMLAAATQQQYQEALFSQMISYQTKQMNQQQIAYAQQYMKVCKMDWFKGNLRETRYSCFMNNPGEAPGHNLKPYEIWLRICLNL